MKHKHRGAGYRMHTSLAFFGSPPRYILTRLIRTFEPLKVPSNTHPRRDSESVHDIGSTSPTPAIFLSSSKDSRNAGFARSGMLLRTCAEIEYRLWRKVIQKLTLSKYPVSHAKSSLRKLIRALRYSFRRRKLLSFSLNCGEALSKPRSRRNSGL